MTDFFVCCIDFALINEDDNHFVEYVDSPPKKMNDCYKFVQWIYVDNLHDNPLLKHMIYPYHHNFLNHFQL
jgi:hypothetical protein